MKRKNIIGLFLLIFFCAAPLFAQEKAEDEEKQISEERYKAVCKPDFVGESISLNVVNADIRDILNYITKQYGYDFVLDNSVGRKVTSVNIENIPWNIALGNILEPEDLGVECEARFFRITTQKKISGVITENAPDAAPLFTEFIKLKKLPPCPKKAPCRKTSLALNHLKAYVAGRLSKRGQVETDETSQTLIITDARDNLNALKSAVELLDNEEFYNEAGKDK
jgi:type II secretory pathway component GspD/PulD (secretin)